MKFTYLLLAISLLITIFTVVLIKNGNLLSEVHIENVIVTSGSIQEKSQVLKKQVLYKESNNISKTPSTSKALVSIKQDVLLSPDELWVQQHQSNREFDLPPTIPDMPVISVEQLEVESNSNSSEQKSDLHDPLQLSYIEAEKRPAIESLTEVIPFELQELENAIVNNEQQNNIEIEEPLLDPDTGLSDKELMQIEDSEAASESYLPID